MSLIKPIGSPPVRYPCFYERQGVAPTIYDRFNPLVVYSMRKTLLSQNKCIRIRRDSDDAEIDVGFSGGWVDEQAIKDFGGYNLLGYTEDLTNAVWSKASAITASPSTEKNPIDEGDGVFLVKSVSSESNKRFVSQHVNGQKISGLGVISGYFKSDGAHLQIRAFGIGNQGVFANFDLTNGTVGNVGNNVISATIEASENGFYHCKLFINNSSFYTAGYILIDNVNLGELPDISTPDIGFFIYGAQIIQGSISLPYQPRLAGGASDCFVTTCYGVAGQNAVQTTEASQPKIYDVATGEVTKENGKPAMVFDGVDDKLELIDDGLIATQPNSIAVVATRKGGIGSFDYLIDGANGKQIVMIGPDNYRLFSGISITSSNSSDTNQHLFLGEFGLTTDKLFIDNIEVASGNAGSNNLGGVTIGGSSNNNNNVLNGVIQELAIFDGTLNNEQRVELHTDINNKFNIY